MRDPDEIRALTEREISESGCLAPCAFLVRLGRIDPRDLQAESGSARLLDCIYGDLAVVAEEVRLAVDYAQQLGLREEPRPVTIPVGTCAELPDDRWAMTAWRRAPEPQLDLFFDNPGRTAAAQLKQALSKADPDAALEHLDALESVDPAHPLAATAPSLIEALQWSFHGDTTWDRVHTAASLSRIALGQEGDVFAARLWLGLASTEEDGSTRQLSALEHAGAWQEILQKTRAVTDPSPELMIRAIRAATAIDNNEQATHWLIRLCFHAATQDTDVEPLLAHPLWESAADDWYEKGLDRLSWSLFPAFLAVRGIVRTLPDDQKDPILTVALKIGREPTNPAHRTTLKQIAPPLFSAIYNR